METVASAELAALEALADERLCASPEEVAAELARHYLGAALPVAPADTADLAASARARRLEWATRSLTQGDILDGFAAYCRDAVDDLEVVASSPTRLELSWRGREQAALEARCGLLFAERLAETRPLLVLAELTAGAIERLLDDEALRRRLAVYDLAGLAKVNAVRSSVFVHFEWFLRDAYGVKVAASDAFTQGLVERGVISLGMG